MFKINKEVIEKKLNSTLNKQGFRIKITDFRNKKDLLKKLNILIYINKGFISGCASFPINDSYKIRYKKDNNDVIELKNWVRKYV